MTKAIIFDCFGVLTTDGWLPFKRTYFGHDPELDQAATDLNRAVDGGLISFDEFMTRVADMAGISKAEAHRQIESNVADDELFAFIRDELKSQYKIGLLSNAGDNWLDVLFSPEQVGLFDAVGLSCETGYVKPAPEAYLKIAEVLDVAPEDCVFIDDQERYCTGAQDTGMRAIVFRSTAQLKADLPRLLKM